MPKNHFGTIRKLPSGSYQARWFQDGRQPAKSFSTRFLAEKFLESKARELGKNEGKYRIARGKRIRSYGISVGEFNQMMEDQGHKCYICDGDNGHIALCIDHDHKTGKVRGLLCNKCNRAIGLLDDNPELLIIAAAYLVGGVVPIKKDYPALKLVQ